MLKQSTQWLWKIHRLPTAPKRTSFLYCDALFLNSKCNWIDFLLLWQGERGPGGSVGPKGDKGDRVNKKRRKKLWSGTVWCCPIQTVGVYLDRKHCDHIISCCRVMLERGDHLALQETWVDLCLTWCNRSTFKPISICYYHLHIVYCPHLLNITHASLYFSFVGGKCHPWAWWTSKWASVLLCQVDKTSHFW